MKIASAYTNPRPRSIVHVKAPGSASISTDACSTTVYFTATVNIQGNDITYASSVTVGDSFTINANGYYGIRASLHGGAGNTMAVTLNMSSCNAVDLSGCNNILVENAATAGIPRTFGCTLWLASGSIIRVQNGGGGLIGSSVNGSFFSIERVS